MQPYWTRAKLWFSTALGVGMILCSIMIIAMPQIVVSSSTGSMNPEGLVSLELTLKIIFGIFISVVLWSMFDTLRRVWRLRLPMV